jgi:hypothetical protein
LGVKNQDPKNQETKMPRTKEEYKRKLTPAGAKKEYKKMQRISE